MLIGNSQHKGSWANLKKILDKKLEEIAHIILRDLAEWGVEDIKKGVKEDWYDSYTPTKYERTYEALNSIEILSDNVLFENNTLKIIIVFGYNTQKISPSLNSALLLNTTEGYNAFQRNDNVWTQHASIVDGMDYSEKIPFIIEYGLNMSGLSDYTNVDMSFIESERQGTYLFTGLANMMKGQIEFFFRERLRQRFGIRAIY